MLPSCLALVSAALVLLAPSASTAGKPSSPKGPQAGHSAEPKLARIHSQYLSCFDFAKTRDAPHADTSVRGCRFNGKPGGKLSLAYTLAPPATLDHVTLDRIRCWGDARDPERTVQLQAWVWELDELAADPQTVQLTTRDLQWKGGRKSLDMSMPRHNYDFGDRHYVLRVEFNELRQIKKSIFEGCRVDWKLTPR